MRKGFTLVELLVVIAIIAILAGILMPVLTRTRESAKAAQCAMNFKQGALAILLYAGDNGDRCVPASERGCGLPGFGRWYDEQNHDRAWPELCQRYLKSWQVIRCPSDPQATDDGLAIDWRTGQTIPPGEAAHRRFEWAFRTHLGLNHNWFSHVAAMEEGQIVVNVRFAGIGAPANTVMLVDSARDREPNGRPFGGGMWAVDSPAWPNDIACWFGGWACWYSAKNGDPDSAECRALWNAWGGAYPWHGSGSLFTTAYADGHVRGNRAGDLLRGVDAFTATILDTEQYPWDTRR